MTILLAGMILGIAITRLWILFENRIRGDFRLELQGHLPSQQGFSSICDSANKLLKYSNASSSLKKQALMRKSHKTKSTDI